MSPVAEMISEAARDLRHLRATPPRLSTPPHTMKCIPLHGDSNTTKYRWRLKSICARSYEVSLEPPAINFSIHALWTKISQQEASHKPDLQVSIYSIQPCSNLSIRDHGLTMLDISTNWNRQRRIAQADRPRRSPPAADLLPALSLPDTGWQTMF